MVRHIGSGWTVLGRTDGSQSLYPCYFCSAKTPKFGKGWRVRLASGEIITVGPDCGRTHLGERFTIDRRRFEAAEALESALQRRRRWLALKHELVETADAILAHEGWARVREIKQQTLFLGNQAMRHLDRIAAGGTSGVQQYHCFEHGGPRQRAQTVTRLLHELEEAPERTKPIVDRLRELEQTVAQHNSLAPVYSSEITAFGNVGIETITRRMPEVEWERDGNELVMRRRSDGLVKRLPVPADLSTPLYATPESKG